jgi:hypothetical protein
LFWRDRLPINLPDEFTPTPPASIILFAIMGFPVLFVIGDSTVGTSGSDTQGWTDAFRLRKGFCGLR